jgi:hypothetical protein
LNFALNEESEACSSLELTVLKWNASAALQITVFSYVDRCDEAWVSRANIVACVLGTKYLLQSMGTNVLTTFLQDYRRSVAVDRRKNEHSVWYTGYVRTAH